jgi:hypothetical protein
MSIKEKPQEKVIETQLLVGNFGKVEKLLLKCCTLVGMWYYGQKGKRFGQIDFGDKTESLLGKKESIEYSVFKNQYNKVKNGNNQGRRIIDLR